MVLLLTVVVGLLAQAAPSPHAQTVDPQELRFAWPAEFEARVESERSRQREQDGKPQPGTRTPATYRMRVSAHPDGRIIRYDDFKLGALSSNPDGGELADAMTALLPTMIVSPAGRFIRAEDTSGLKSVFQLLLDSTSAKSGQLPSGLKDMLDRLASDEFISRMTAQEWDAIVGTWVGTPVSRTRFEFRAEQPTTLWPDVKVPMLISVAMTAERDCTRAGAVQRCAVFELTSRVDQRGMTAIMKRILDGMKDMEGIKYEAFDVLTTTTVETELATMVPHNFEMVRTTSMTIALKGDTRRSMKQVDRRTTRYTYPAK